MMTTIIKIQKLSELEKNLFVAILIAEGSEESFALEGTMSLSQTISFVPSGLKALNKLPLDLLNPKGVTFSKLTEETKLKIAQQILNGFQRYGGIERMRKVLPELARLFLNTQ